MSGPLGISAFEACSLAWLVWISWLGAYVAGKFGSIEFVCWHFWWGVRCVVDMAVNWMGLDFMVGGVDRDML